VVDELRWDCVVRLKMEGLSVGGRSARTRAPGEPSELRVCPCGRVVVCARATSAAGMAEADGHGAEMVGVAEWLIGL
jgi:hypothetical protein